MNTELSDQDFKSLFIAALFSLRKDLDDQQRALLITSFLEIDPHDHARLRSELNRFVNRGHRKSGLKPAPPGWPSQRQVEKAMVRARDWVNRGVFVLTAEQLQLTTKPLKTLSPLFFAYGNKQVLNARLAAILNSRKSRRISPKDRWIRVTKGLFKLAEKNSYGLVTSLGNYPYELVCCLAKMTKQPAVIMCDNLLPFMLPREKTKQYLKKYEQMFPSGQTLFLSPFTPGRVASRRHRALRRDHCLVSLSSCILAAEIRSEGNMERLIKEAVKQRKMVKVFQPERFDRDTAGNKSLLEFGAQKYCLTSDTAQISLKTKRPRLPGQTKIQTDLKNNSYLIHFTRSCPGPWPGETLYEYYKSLVEGNEGAAHTAFDTLNRILKEQRIRGSNHLIRGQTPVVSFTGQPLKNIESLIRYRRGLIRWAFEPYGIAIAKEILVKVGVRPAIYCGEEEWEGLPENQKYRFQLHQPPDTDWTMEKEWRLPGDLDLKTISSKYIRIILPSLQEAEQIASDFGYHVTLMVEFVKTLR
ncbi:MAG: hypothetical protein JRI34_01615 [Deltaproteobacteria bacterium]|nr:hypothetical protein [Deltaproteobacteria bacterium]